MAYSNENAIYNLPNTMEIKWLTLVVRISANLDSVEFKVDDYKDVFKKAGEEGKWKMNVKEWLQEDEY